VRDRAVRCALHLLEQEIDLVRRRAGVVLPGGAGPVREHDLENVRRRVGRRAVRDERLRARRVVIGGGAAGDDRLRDRERLVERGRRGARGRERRGGVEDGEGGRVELDERLRARAELPAVELR
jgi:hypothetical protein